MSADTPDTPDTPLAGRLVSVSIEECERRCAIAVAREHHRMVEAVAAERERADAAEAKIAAVETVLSRWNPPDDVQHMLLRNLWEQVRAALGGEAEEL